MSISIEFSDGKGGRTPGQDLATNRGWSEFGAWADNLQLPDYEHVVQLWEHGYTSPVKAVVPELRKAVLSEHPSKNVRSVAENLLALCERRVRAGVVFVADDS
jgi:hypothetical protein